jgi:hypothetical protein
VPAPAAVRLLETPPPGVAPMPVAAAAPVPRERAAPEEAGAPDRVRSQVAPVPAVERREAAFPVPALPGARAEGGAQLDAAGALPEPPAREATTAQGDIYLDGARIGRWIIEHLAREAERPRSGGAGFDGRMSPAWSGTL